MTFPVIKHIDDVLPHLEGKDEFRVVHKEHYSYIDYSVCLETTFDNDVAKECRGIKFYPSGEIASRPLHKFWNLNEREETHVDNLPWESGWDAFTKLDGSLIHPLVIYDEPAKGRILPATKAGLTEVAQQVLDEGLWTDEVVAWCSEKVMEGKTPCFEYISPNNRIVVKYDTPQLKLIAVRDNLTGKYVDSDENIQICAVGQVVGDRRGEFLHHVQKMNGTENEGVILRFGDGETFVKLKSEDYVLMHKAKDQIFLEKNRIAMFLDNRIDDVLPLLSEEDAECLVDDLTTFFEHRNGVRHGVVEYVRHCRRMFDGDRKAFAIENSKNQPAQWASLGFALWNHGEEGLDNALEKMYRRATYSQSNVDALKAVNILPRFKKEGDENE